MAPGRKYDRRKGTYRRAADIEREREERRLEVERWDRERFVKLAVIRKGQEKAEGSRVLRRKREWIEKEHEKLVIALRRKKAVIMKKEQSALMVRHLWLIMASPEMDDEVVDKKAEKRRRKKMTKRAREQNSQ